MINIVSFIKDILYGNDKDVSNALSKIKEKSVSHKRTKIKSARVLRSNTNEYVYDISMSDRSNPWFFANNVLVHNTDSVYFTAYESLKNQNLIDAANPNKDTFVQLYDTIANEVNETFPAFMLNKFNVPNSRSNGVIKAGREIVATSGLFIKKKRYAALMYDKEGNRYDIDGKDGKLKAMGLDLRRSDTPKYIQNFLKELLNDVLLGRNETEVLDKIKLFRENFNKMYPWQKGSPKGVNNLTNYREKEELNNLKKMKGQTVENLRMPGHVRAALNWNFLRDKNNDYQTMPILDGQKIIVCKLKVTADNFMNCIAYPVDEKRLPKWFTDLPFDDSEMENVLIDKKVKNLLWVLKWDLESTTNNGQLFGSLFDMSALDEPIDDDDDEFDEEEFDDEDY